MPMRMSQCVVNFLGLKATHEKLTSDMLAARGKQGVEIRLAALTQAKEEELRHALTEENYFQVSRRRLELFFNKKYLYAKRECLNG